MMKTIFKEISLRSNEQMGKESTEMLSKLNDIEYFHFKCYSFHSWKTLSHCIGRSYTSKPSWHEVGVNKNFICPNGAKEIVKAGISPFDKSICSFLFGSRLSISFFSYVIIFTKTIKNMMNNKVNDLYRFISTV